MSVLSSDASKRLLSGPKAACVISVIIYITSFRFIIRKSRLHEHSQNTPENLMQTHEQNWLKFSCNKGEFKELETTQAWKTFREFFNYNSVYLFKSIELLEYVTSPQIKIESVHLCS